MNSREFTALVKRLHKARIEKAGEPQLSAAVKAELRARGVTEAIAGEYRVSVTSTIGERFDTTRFKADHPDLYREYLTTAPQERLYLK